MKRIFKSVAALFLGITILTTSIPVNAQETSKVSITEGKIVYTINLEAHNACVKELDDYDKTLSSITIPSCVEYEGEEYKVTEIGANAFNEAGKINTITSITMPDTITVIGDYAFNECRVLESMIIPDSVTELGGHVFSNCTKLASLQLSTNITTIGTRAFENCSALESINIPSAVGLDTVGTCCFYGCAKLETVTFDEGAKYVPKNLFDSNQHMAHKPPLKNVILSNTIEEIGREAFYGIDTIVNLEIPISVKKIDYRAFWLCSSLRDTQLPANLEYLGEDAFGYCKALTTIRIPKTLTSVGGLGSPFIGCTGLKNITIEDGIEKLPNHLFQSCSAITKVDVINKDIEGTIDDGDEVVLRIPDSVKELGIYEFELCANLKSVRLPNSVTKMGTQAISSCENLKEIILPHGLETMGDAAFSSDIKLETVNIPNTVTSAERMLSGCTNLKTVTIEDGMKKIPGKMFYNCGSLTRIVDKDTELSGEETGLVLTLPDSIEEIGNSAFMNCHNLKSVKVPQNVTKMGTQAISICEELKEIELPHGLETMGDYAFSSDTKLETVNIPNTVTSAKCMLSGCASLKNVTVEKGRTIIPTEMFYNCDSLTKVVTQDTELSEEETGLVLTLPDTIEEIGNSAFMKCANLESVIVPKKVTKLGSEAISTCAELKEVELPHGLVTIGENAFYSDIKLETVNIPNTVTSAKRMLSGCTSLKSVTIEEGRTVIPTEMFYNCSALTKVVNEGTDVGEEETGLVLTLPNSIEEIGSAAFMNCQNLISIDMPKGIKLLGAKSVQSCTNLETVSFPDNPDYPNGDITFSEKLGASYYVFAGDTKLTILCHPLTGVEDYAKKRDIPYEYILVPYDIHYVLNGGTNNLDNPDYYTWGNPVEFSDPTREHYAFDGWFAEDTFDNQVFKIENSKYAKTVYAKWTPIEYAITYVLDEGINNQANPATHNVEDDAITLKAPSKQGYDFDGWYTDSEFTEESEITEIPANSSDELILYAKWTLHICDVTFVPGSAATCTTAGNVEYYSCSCGKCFSDAECENEITSEDIEIPATGHTVVEDKAVAATCTEPGLTKGSHCSVCETVLIEQKEVPATGHVNTEVRNKKEATCGEKGYTGDKYCKKCNKKLSTGTEIPATGHTVVEDKAVAATCTEPGLTKGSHCSVCETVLIEQKEVPATGHVNKEVRNKKDASCEAKGYTGDTYCKDCGTKLSTGTETSATGHVNKEVRNKKDATATTAGYTGDTYCKDCNSKISSGKEIPATGEKNNGSTGAGNNGTQGNDANSNGTIQPVTDTKKSDAATYEVSSTTKNIVTYSETKTTSKTAKVPDTIKVDGKTYKVTAVAADAFKGNKKVTTVTVGKNVTSIGKNAFSGAKNLKSVTVNGNTLKKVGKNAFKGVKKNCKITIQAKDKKQYNKIVKMIKKSGAKNVKFKFKKKK